MDIFILNILVPLTSIITLFFLLVYSVVQKPSEMQKHIATLTISTILFLFGYMIRVVSVSMEMATVGAYITYMGQPFILLSALMMISTFYGYHIRPWMYIILSVLGLTVPVTVLTNQYHLLFYPTSYFDPTAKFSPLISTHGPLYFANLGMVAGYFIAYNILIYRGYKKADSPIKRRLSVYSILMLFSGVLGYVIYFFNFAGGYDTTIVGIFFSTVFLSILFFRCRIFDIVEKTKENALEVSKNGLIIFDDANTIIYENNMAKSLVKIGDVMKYLEFLPNGENKLDCNDKHYSVVAHAISNRSDYLGKSIEIFDISDSVNHQAELEKAVNETTSRLETIQRTIFGSMASIVEARSLETGDHIKRVSSYARNIALSLRKSGKYTDILTDEYINILALAAPLHDIGKVSIPDAILQKPGRLSDEEFEIMKTHAQKGVEIIETTMNGLESEEYITMAKECAEYHHEKWNGTGYPSGLKGNEIPLAGRIIALADCYDAMISKRCYKDPIPESEARKIISEEKGKHFDPDVVDAFLKYAQ